MKKERINIGGQAVIEGVMMRGPKKMAIAVRSQNGDIKIDKSNVKNPAQKHKWLGWPLVRGCTGMATMLSTGMNTIQKSMEMAGIQQEEPGKFEKKLSNWLGIKLEKVMMGVAIILAILLAFALFILLPAFAATRLRALGWSSLAVNICEGIVRLIIFGIYLYSTTFLEEMKRVFMYHGAEHKAVYCYEAGQPLEPAVVKNYSRLHPRCGTSFLLIVMLISILLFSVLGWLMGMVGLSDGNLLIRVASRLLLLPIIAGVSYEILRIGGKYDNAFTRILIWPGMQLQRLTTREPDDSMLEVAIAALQNALDDNGDEQPAVTAAASEK